MKKVNSYVNYLMIDEKFSKLPHKLEDPLTFSQIENNFVFNKK